MRRRLLLIVLPLLLLPGALRASVDWIVRESTDEGLLLRVEVDGARLLPVDPSEQDYWTVEVDGLHAGGEPGLPLLPSAGRWILLPPDAEIRLDVRVLERERLGSARLLPHPTPRIDRERALGGPRLLEEIQESERYATFRRDESDVAALGKAVYARRQHMAPLTLRPVLYDAATGQVDLAKVVEIRVRFSGSSVGMAPLDGGRPDRAILGTTLNPEKADLWRCLSPTLRARRERLREAPSIRMDRARVDGLLPLDELQLDGPVVRLRVDRTGLWRVRLDDLLDAGLPSGVLRRTLRLYTMRPSEEGSAAYPQPLTADVPFSWTTSLDEAEAVSAADEFIFYGFAPQEDAAERSVDGETFPAAMERRADNFNTTNVYYLASALPPAEGWERMPDITLGPAQGPVQPSFVWEESFEDDAAYQENPETVLEPRYHWNDYMDTELSKSLLLQHPVAGQTMEVRWGVLSSTQSEALMVDFWMERDGVADTLLADVNLGAAGFARRTELEGTVSTDPFTGQSSNFVDFRMERPDETGEPQRLKSWLSDVTLRYPAQYRATFDVLRFHTDQDGGTVDLSVEGFTRDDLLLFEWTDPRRPRRVTLGPETLLADGEGYRLSLQVPQAVGERRHFAAQPRSRIPLVRGDLMDADDLVDPLATYADRQVLAIGPALFEDAIQPWLSWRRDHDLGGWNYDFVDVQQIYDHFSGGLKSPGAIKRFVELAYLLWDARAVLLVGDANENARDIHDDPTDLSTPDHVPPSLHIQTYDDQELLASDKWYVTFDIPGGYPGSLLRGPDMLIGRLPAKTAEQLSTMVQKILAYERPGADDEWRRRTLWVADDAWSTDYLGSATQSVYCEHPAEWDFGTSQTRNANVVTNALDQQIEGRPWLLDDSTSDFRVGTSCLDGGESRGSVIQSVTSVVRPRFFSLLNEGWLWVSYQGHAAYNVLAHESLVETFNLDSQLQNEGRPFLFFGMGCHVSDFQQSIEGGGGSRLPAFGEYLVTMPNRGAIASYGSSGFEFLTPNRTFMEIIADNFFDRGRVSSESVGEIVLPSQWILGEQMAQSEFDVLDSDAWRKEEMMSQYNLLGDPLLRMDALPPRMSLRADGTLMGDGDTLLPEDGARQVDLVVGLVDETGIGALRISDSEGRSYADLALDPPADPRQRQGTAQLPVYAQGYTLTVEAFDGSYPDARPRTLTLTVPFELVVRLDGEEIDEGTGSFVPGQQVELELEFTSPVGLGPEEIELTMDGADLGALQKQGLDPEGRVWRLLVAATGVMSEEPQALHLTLAGATTDFPLTSQAPVGLAIHEHFPFPNPSPGPMRFVARATRPVTWASLTVFDLSGNTVYRHRAAAQGEEFIVEWNGRDTDGDEMANGVYLYRLEAGDAGGSARSDMGRLMLAR